MNLHRLALFSPFLFTLVGRNGRIRKSAELVHLTIGTAVQPVVDDLVAAR